MSGAMYVAASGALVQQMRLEVLSNNLANVNTIGFKEDQLIFQADAQKSSGGGTSPADNPTGSTQTAPLSSTFGYMTKFSEGILKETGNQLDFALSGDGFFTVETENGPQYTRKGNFTISEEGLLITQDGMPVLGEGGSITIEGDRVEVDTQGNISVDGTQVDTLRVVNFTDNSRLIKTGDTLFKPVDPDPEQIEPDNISVNQGFLESSNVEAIRAMTEMIETMRLFESYQKAIQTQDQTTSQAINDVGAPTQ
ncbi:MAG: flagellar basal-body rod protein FlgF [Desulfobacteraceae bacterium]|nr:flagellar basal-body rod protein FlgF [Desulfobacteraceae bacterium]